MGAHDPESQNDDNIFIGNIENESNDGDKQFDRGNHPNSRANLQPFQKGVSGNPLGRPQRYEKLKRILNDYGSEEQKDWNGKSKGTRRELVWEEIWRKAICGDMRYVQLLAKLGCLDED